MINLYKKFNDFDFLYKNYKNKNKYLAYNYLINKIYYKIYINKRNINITNILKK